MVSPTHQIENAPSDTPSLKCTAWQLGMERKSRNIDILIVNVK
jgi:hypothetical protein